MFFALLRPRAPRSTAARQSNGIWSLAWSGDNREIIAGTADQSLYVYDVAAGRTVVTAVAGADDVNAVAYADESSQMIFTGCDDHEVKVWDRRLLGAGGPTGGGAVGVFLGHNEGITHLDSKGDGRYLISNSKDQSIKASRGGRCCCCCCWLEVPHAVAA